MAFDNFPYTNFHELNLDYILREMERLAKEYNETSERLDGFDAWKSGFVKYVLEYFQHLDVAAQVRDLLDQMEIDGRLAELLGTLYYVGDNKGWRVFKSDSGMVQQTIVTKLTDVATSHADSGYWYVDRDSYRPLDMPLAGEAVCVGSCDSYGAWPTSVRVSKQRLAFRLRSFQDLTGKTVYGNFIVTGARKTAPSAPPSAASPFGAEAVNIAKSYYDARVHGRGFAYGANWTYKGSGAGKLNDGNGKGLMECDTLVFMALTGKRYENSPYAADLTANAHYQFSDYTAGSAAWALPWIDNTDYGDRITNTGSESWFFWANNRVFSDRAQLASGDVVFFRKPTTKWFDNAYHVAIVSIENGEQWCYHVSSWRRPDEEFAPVVRHDKLDDMIAGGFYGSDMVFARPNYEA